MEQLHIKMKASTVLIMLPTITSQRIMFRKKVYAEGKLSARLEMD